MEKPDHELLSLRTEFELEGKFEPEAGARFTVPVLDARAYENGKSSQQWVELRNYSKDIKKAFSNSLAPA